MWLQALSAFFSHMLCFALHIVSPNSFPKPLSAKEETACFERMAQGDCDARNCLIEHNLRLVAHIIKKYYSSVREQDDLISIGTIGLIKAVSTYNYQKGTRFATYAAKCIENEILMHFRGQKKNAMNLYISDPIDTDKDGNALTLGDVVADESNIVEDVDLKLKSERLYRSLDRGLDPREKEILILRYGLYGRTPMTQREVAGKLDISRSYVSRIEKKATLKLRQEFDKPERL